MEAGVIFHTALMAAASFSLPLLFTRGFLVQFSCYHLSAELFLPTRFRGSTRNNDEEEEKKGRCCSRDSSFDFSAFSIWKYLDERNDGFAVSRDPFRGRKEVSTRYFRQVVFLVGCVTFLFSVHSIYFH